MFKWLFNDVGVAPFFHCKSFILFSSGVRVVVALDGKLLGVLFGLFGAYFVDASAAPSYES